MPVLPPPELGGAQAQPAGEPPWILPPPGLSPHPQADRSGPPLHLPPPSTLLPPRAVVVALPRVERFSFEGNESFPDEVLVELVADFLHRELTPEDLDEISHTLTTWYIDHGYINSGAAIPDNPLFPALRTGPTAVSGAARRKQIPSSQNRSWHSGPEGYARDQ